VRLLILAVAAVSLLLFAAASEWRGYLLATISSGLLICWGRYFVSYLQSTNAIFLIDYDGAVTLKLADQAPLRCQLVKGALITDWCCRIQLITVEATEGLPESWHKIWLWRDSFTESDYRRLTRCLLYWQHSVRRVLPDQGA
jgi:hypothetical protein